MEDTLKRQYERDTGLDLRMVLLLCKDREYGEAFVEHLTMKHTWMMVMSNVLDESVEDADLILAEEGWFEQLRHRDDLWNKTIFLMEHHPNEDPITKGEFPFLVWKYDGFSRISRKVSEAIGRLCKPNPKVRRELAPLIILGAWDEDSEDECLDVLEEVAETWEETLLYISLEKFLDQKRESKEELEEDLNMLLYYIFDRMELEGLSPEDTVKDVLMFRNALCHLPGFEGLNPLFDLDEDQWEVFLEMLQRISEAKATILWTGKEEILQFQKLGIPGSLCIYRKPKDPVEEEESLRWRRLKTWLEEKGEDMLHTEIRMADSWTEILGMVINFGEELDRS